MNHSRTTEHRTAKHRTAICAVSMTLVFATLSGCVPLIVGGAVIGGTLVATDRRTSGAQLEDEGIELRGNSRIRENFPDRAHINVTSYNRQVLLTGEVPTEQDKKLAEQVISRVENVQKIANELAVMDISSVAARSGDALTTARIRASFIDAKDLTARSFKVVTERSITYLMGRVTLREAERATDIARSIGSVQKVVRIFEIIPEEELLRQLPQPAKPDSSPATSPVTSPVTAPAPALTPTPAPAASSAS